MVGSHVSQRRVLHDLAIISLFKYTTRATILVDNHHAYRGSQKNGATLCANN